MWIISKNGLYLWSAMAWHICSVSTMQSWLQRLGLHLIWIMGWRIQFNLTDTNLCKLLIDIVLHYFIKFTNKTSEFALSPSHSIIQNAFQQECIILLQTLLNSQISCAPANLQLLFYHVLLLLCLINGKCQNTLRIHPCAMYHICNCVKMDVGNTSNMKCDIYENLSETCDLPFALIP